VRFADAVFTIDCAVLGALTVIAMVACAPTARLPRAHESVWPPVHEPAVVVALKNVSEAGSGSENATPPLVAQEPAFFTSYAAIGQTRCVRPLVLDTPEPAPCGQERFGC